MDFGTLKITRLADGGMMVMQDDCLIPDFQDNFFDKRQRWTDTNFADHICFPRITSLDLIFCGTKLLDESEVIGYYDPTLASSSHLTNSLPPTLSDVARLPQTSKPVSDQGVQNSHCSNRSSIKSRIQLSPQPKNSPISYQTTQDASGVLDFGHGHNRILKLKSSSIERLTKSDTKADESHLRQPIHFSDSNPSHRFLQESVSKSPSFANSTMLNTNTSEWNLHDPFLNSKDASSDLNLNFPLKSSSRTCESAFGDGDLRSRLSRSRTVCCTPKETCSTHSYSGTNDTPSMFPQNRYLDPPKSKSPSSDTVNAPEIDEPDADTASSDSEDSSTVSEFGWQYQNATPSMFPQNRYLDPPQSNAPSSVTVNAPEIDEQHADTPSLDSEDSCTVSEFGWQYQNAWNDLAGVRSLPKPPSEAEMFKMPPLPDSKRPPGRRKHREPVMDEPPKYEPTKEDDTVSLYAE